MVKFTVGQYVRQANLWADCYQKVGVIIEVNPGNNYTVRFKTKTAKFSGYDLKEYVPGNHKIISTNITQSAPGPDFK